MIRRPPRSTLSSSSAASDVYKRQIVSHAHTNTCDPDTARPPSNGHSGSGASCRGMWHVGAVRGTHVAITPCLYPQPALITAQAPFTGGQTLLNLASFSTSLDFERPAFDNAARYLNSETNSVSRDDWRMSSPSLTKFGPRIPEILSCKRDPLKNFTAIMC